MGKSEVKTASQSFLVTGVEVSTTGYKGGDAGWGGHTTIKLKNEAGSFIEGAIDGLSPRQADTVEISVRGDWELDDLMDSLAFALRHLCKVTGRRVDIGMHDRSSRFFFYLDALAKSYHRDGNKSLKGISDLARQYNISSISVPQFFQFGLNDERYASGMEFNKSEEIYTILKQRNR
jgi:hypothetical protein